MDSLESLVVAVLVLAAGVVGLAAFGLFVLIRAAVRRYRAGQETPAPCPGPSQARSGPMPALSAGNGPPAALHSAPDSVSTTAPGCPPGAPTSETPTMSTQPKPPVTDRLFIRALVIAGITLGLLIPLYFVNDIVDERSILRRTAVANIASLWGQSQTVSGPVLVIPYLRTHTYKETTRTPGGPTEETLKTGLRQDLMVVLPASVSFGADLNPQIRKRGIYDYVVYTTPITISGTFRVPEPSAFGEELSRILWDKAWLALGVTDLKAITSVAPLAWNGKPAAPYSPGTRVDDLLGPGFHTTVALPVGSEGKVLPFSLALDINGSGGLHFTPVGETTRIKITGAWPHPSFSGNILPTTRTVTDSDFSAEWTIPHLSRTYPQIGVLGKNEFSGGAVRSFTAGVDLFETVSLYSQVNRAVKYGLLFIGLTFVALLSFELVSRARLHLMQYGLVGIAMTLFYLVLLSLAEHTVFPLAFSAAAGVSVVMNSLYIAAALRSTKKGLIIAGLLSALYVLLYALLQLEDYALAIGTAMVLVMVAILMYLTRHLSVSGKDQDSPAGPSAP
ncbi:cell envelope integrity protein CreD [Phaeovibrio sulfidiphilus]|uniref:Cell envelope integrity protein CreD n=1 Tax=Phaeovibrio sulfidiphilus TaxID=1220600 RepID=A0A8J6YXR3_9PROT|nr:cell envelope integrity protein CreD [Phaeovibrio sulfidiphilus]MBE1237617.1 cell envelope integrity protein CreD [Phaeovibrio sulfidiphilus]